jgi:hypothetical protein
MDPVTMGAVVLAIVSGAAGEAGGRLWDGLRKLAHGRQAGNQDKDSATEGTSGVAQIVALEQGRGGEREAVALAEALLTRADGDPAFRQRLEVWWKQASRISMERVNITNTVSGGTQLGPVFQGRDFTFNTRSPSKPLEE